MAAVAGIDELRAPGFGQRPGLVRRAIGVGRARDQYRAEGQGLLRDRAEIVGHAGDGALGALGGRGDQEGAGDLMRFQMLGRMRDGAAAGRMGDDDDRLSRGAHGGDDAVCPAVAGRLVPVLLLDAAGGGQLGFPAALPMVGAGARPAGDDQDVGVGGFHRSGRSGFRAKPVARAWAQSVRPFARARSAAAVQS